ncbi:competence protein CoiA family protein [Streptomyces sp. NPDC057430]|uniref:competence protein CoiA family protein n=1 Tax=Streptomyces sp. NPDC057430 TaxID=3346131 RepID=UPI003698773D
MGDSAWDRKTRRLVEVPGGAAGLEPGLARGRYDGSSDLLGRYVCRACTQDLILRGAKPGSKKLPHFSHQNSQGCPASAERRRRIELDDQVVIDLRDRLIRAWPDATVTLELPHAPGETPVAGMPPAIVICGPQGTVVVERPPSLPGPEQLGTRLRAVRARYGAGASHVWFLAKDPLQFARCGKLNVAPRGRDRAVHVTIAPTEQQLAIVAAGGGVYWLDGQQVLIPYGVHDFAHEPGQKEDWGFTDWRRSWRNDWFISHPLPARDASRWGLVPSSLHQLTSAKATFDLAEARDLMQRLEDVQRARWRRRRADAAELYASRHAPANLVAPTDITVASPAAPAEPATQESAASEPVPSSGGSHTGSLTTEEPTGVAGAAAPAVAAVPEPSAASSSVESPAPAVAVPPPPPYPPYSTPAARVVRQGRWRGFLRRVLGGHGNER